jgi:hypothetical protein
MKLAMLVWLMIRTVHQLGYDSAQYDFYRFDGWVYWRVKRVLYGP